MKKVVKKFAVHMLTGVLFFSLICPLSSSAQITSGEQRGMISVDLILVRNDVAKKLNVKADQLPLTVQAPVGVAAQVCKMKASDLDQKLKNGQGACQAKTTNPALNQIILRHISPPNKQG